MTYYNSSKSSYSFVVNIFSIVPQSGVLYGYGSRLIICCCIATCVCCPGDTAKPVISGNGIYEDGVILT